MGLWEQLLASPADLSAARVWADALSEKGDPQGEFIQLSCALDELPPEDPRRRELALRVRRLEARHHRSWLDQVWGRRAPTDPSAPGFFRGLPFRVNTNLPWVLANKLLEQRPVAALTLNLAGQKELGELARVSQLKNVVDLSMAVVPNESKAAASLFESQNLGPLHRLALQNLSAGAIASLAGCASLRSLTTLELPSCLLTDEGAAALAQSPHLQHVTRLCVNGESLTVKGLTALLDGKWKLNQLAVWRAPLGPKGAEALVAHRAASNLRVLDLEGCELGVAGAQAIGSAKSLAQLHTLHLDLEKGKPKGLDGWDAFLSGFALHGLRALDMSHSPLRIAGAKALAKTKALSQLESLNLAGCFLGDEGVAELAKAKNFPALVTLNLNGNSMKEEGVPALALGPLLATVEELSLSHNKFGSDGGKALGSSKRLGALRVITLGHNWLGVLGMRSLLGNPAVKRLEEIREGFNNYAGEVLASYVKSKSLALISLDASDARKVDLLALTKLERASTLMQLRIASPDFDDEVAQAFVASAHLKDLGALDVRSENLTAKGKALLDGHYGARADVRAIAGLSGLPPG